MNNSVKLDTHRVASLSMPVMRTTCSWMMVLNGWWVNLPTGTVLGTRGKGISGAWKFAKK